MLGYFLGELIRQNCCAIVATAPGSRVARLLPPGAIPVWLEPSPEFSPRSLWNQSSLIKKLQATQPFDILHGWAARDWELASLAAMRCNRPAIGTLHDHPSAPFISSRRQRLMRLCARFGLKKIICVSRAVQTACIEATYPASKLAVVRNGLPTIECAPPVRVYDSFRLGFLGAFSERKGLRDLLLIADTLSKLAKSWELIIAGGPQDTAGEQLLSELRARYSGCEWWARVSWPGWVSSPQTFLRELDVLIVPSSDFDPFPTVLLEAGQVGLPVLAARVGGVSEIVTADQTGWLYDPGDVKQAVGHILSMIANPSLCQDRGNNARELVARVFSADAMVSNYLRIYDEVLNHRRPIS